MIRLLAVVSWLALPFSAWAENAPSTLPNLFKVVGVADNDQLNIRAEPNAAGEILGAIAPKAEKVEVIALSDDGKWGLVGMAEGNGWVAMRYLAQMPATVPAEVPRPLACHGTEPFWSLRVDERSAKFATPDSPEARLQLKDEASAEAGFAFDAQDDAGRDFRLIASAEACSDGMSDRRYGYSARIFVIGWGGNSLLSGCCTLDGR